MEPPEQPPMEPPELDYQEAEPEPLELMEPPAAHHTPVELSEDPELEIKEAEATTSETTD